MRKIEIFVCDHVEREGTRQPSGAVVCPWVCRPEDDPGQAYADFRSLYNVWRQGNGDIIGFMGYRKYIRFPGFCVPATPHAVYGWLNTESKHFNEYRTALSKWDGASILPLLATHDIIVTPPFLLYDKPVLEDFAISRSQRDATTLRYALAQRAIEPFSGKIYPYIFVTRWSVFDRFMKFAWPLAQELEPHCKGVDSTNEAYKRRPMSYVLERAFSLWLESSGLSYTELPIVNCWELENEGSYSVRSLQQHPLDVSDELRGSAHS